MRVVTCAWTSTLEISSDSSHLQVVASSPGMDHLIRRLRQVVQNRLLLSVRWADISQLSTRDRRCPAAWQQYWQQWRPNGTDPRPSASGRTYRQLARMVRALCGVAVAAVSNWLLLLLSPLLSAAGPGPYSEVFPALRQRPVLPRPLARTRLLPNLTADGLCQGAAQPITK